jgi:predicted ATPase
LDWSPQGVCLLSGANGAGKTTVLEAIRFLRNAFLRGVQQAIRFAGGPTGFRRLQTTEDVVFELEADGVCWRLELPTDNEGFHAYYGERLIYQGKTVLEVPRFQSSYQIDTQERSRTDRPALSTLLTLQPDPWLKSFCELIAALRIYDDYSVRQVVNAEAENEPDIYLYPSGTNLVQVLRKWKGAERIFNGQFAWVMKKLRSAFPDLIEELEFIEEKAVFFPPDASDPDSKLPLSRAAAGLLTGLFQLTAIAGARPGSLIGFDEMENQLHPHAIRSILRAMRERAEEKQLTIVLTTHSPVLMNAFHDCSDQFYVLHRSLPVQPVALSKLRDEDALMQVALGDLYDRLDFGGPDLSRLKS